MLQLPTPGFLQYTSLEVLKSVSFILKYLISYFSWIILHSLPLYLMLFFLFGFSISILSFTKLPKFLSSVKLLHLINSWLSYLYLPIYCSKILLSVFVLWYIAKVKEYYSLPPSVVDILPFTLPPQPLNFFIPRFNHATLLPSFVL